MDVLTCTPTGSIPIGETRSSKQNYQILILFHVGGKPKGGTFLFSLLSSIIQDSQFLKLCHNQRRLQGAM
jgi:hypothetical protein